MGKDVKKKEKETSKTNKKNEEKTLKNGKETAKKKEKNVKAVSEKKEKHENVFNRISKYFRGVLKEIKRIRWTNRKDLIKYSIATIAFVIFFGIYFYGIDWIALLIRKAAQR